MTAGFKTLIIKSLWHQPYPEGEAYYAINLQQISITVNIV
jgi:hypothetical protein